MTRERVLSDKALRGIRLLALLVALVALGRFVDARSEASGSAGRLSAALGGLGLLLLAAMLTQLRHRSRLVVLGSLLFVVVVAERAVSKGVFVPFQTGEACADDLLFEVRPAGRDDWRHLAMGARSWTFEVTTRASGTLSFSLSEVVDRQVEAGDGAGRRDHTLAVLQAPVGAGGSSQVQLVLWPGEQSSFVLLVIRHDSSEMGSFEGSGWAKEGLFEPGYAWSDGMAIRTLGASQSADIGPTENHLIDSTALGEAVTGSRGERIRLAYLAWRGSGDAPTDFPILFEPDPGSHFGAPDAWELAIEFEE